VILGFIFEALFRGVQVRELSGRFFGWFSKKAWHLDVEPGLCTHFSDFDDDDLLLK
jgi:hypothetical protein